MNMNSLDKSNHEHSTSTYGAKPVDIKIHQKSMSMMLQKNIKENKGNMRFNQKKKSDQEQSVGSSAQNFHKSNKKHSKDKDSHNTSPVRYHSKNARRYIQAKKMNRDMPKVDIMPNAMNNNSRQVVNAGRSIGHSINSSIFDMDVLKREH